MNKSAFLQLIQQAANISDQQTEELEKVAAAFPYCQTAHLLLAKSAYDKGSMLSTQRLRRASAYATNRQLLKRIIYTSPVAAPVFDEALVEDYHHNEAEKPVSPEVSLSEIPEVAIIQAATPEEPILQIEDDNTIIAESVITSEQYDDAESITEAPVQIHEEQETADFEQDKALYAEEEKVEEIEHAESINSLSPDKDILEQPMEKLDSELALLLTIKSLSPSFTDLLAQKPDIEQEPRAPIIPLAPQDEEQAPTPNNEVTELEAPEHPQPKDELAAIIAAEAATAAQNYYSLKQTEKEATQTLPVSLSEPESAVPEEAEVKYAFDEIDHMFQQDVLGYWMSSSRMGEALQLKEENEFTRQRPAAFHPELILEYSKTHDLIKLEEEVAPALHEQQDIIDQFLKINPRLKALNNIKLKPEPQEDLSLKSTKIKRGIASESLANIFLKQGKVKKAIKIYEQLILKYPEKKSYFAEQIEKLQNLS